MLKRIPVAQVRLGMYIQELCGSWVDHPFWRKSFRLEDQDMLVKLTSSQVREVIIDSDKGLDVSPGQDTIDTAVVLNTPPQQNAPQAAGVVGKLAITPVSAEQEHERAKKILKHSKEAVSSMFTEVRMGRVLNAESAMPLVQEISNSVLRNGGALISLARLKHKDDYTYLHSVAVCALMVALGRQLQLTEDDIRHAGLGGLLHDIGKASISLDILNKPGKLTDEEFAEVKLHTTRGYAILLQAEGVPTVALDVCLHHHEKLDGTGYPEGLKSDEISLFAKMGAVCDVYDALTSSRSYKEAWEPGVALQRMASWNTSFDELVFKAFVRTIGIYPVGSMVKLKSGRLAVVTEQSEKSLLKPRVNVFFSVKSNSRIPIETLELAKATCQDEILGHEDPAEWGIKNLQALWI